MYVHESPMVAAVASLAKVWSCVAPGGQEELDGAHTTHQSPTRLHTL